MSCAFPECQEPIKPKKDPKAGCRYKKVDDENKKGCKVYKHVCDQSQQSFSFLAN